MTMIKRLSEVVRGNRKQVISMLSSLIKKGSEHIDKDGRFMLREDSPAWVLIDNGDGEIEDTRITSFKYDNERDVLKFYIDGSDDDYVENTDCLNFSENNVYDEFADIVEDELG